MVTYTCICNRWLHMPVTDGYVRIKKTCHIFQNTKQLRWPLTRQPTNQPTNHTITPTKILQRHLRFSYYRMYHLSFQNVTWVTVSRVRACQVWRAWGRGTLSFLRGRSESARDCITDDGSNGERITFLLELCD